MWERSIIHQVWKEDEDGDRELKALFLTLQMMLDVDYLEGQNG
jgi:hypothetical protein